MTRIRLHLCDLFSDELYLAGQLVPSGLYRDIGTGREVLLKQQEVLPASLDGRVAAYICVRYTWAQQWQQAQQRTL